MIPNQAPTIVPPSLPARITDHLPFIVHPACCPKPQDRLVLILDDTEQVWPHHAQNLIKVERYHFFPASVRQWHLGATSLLEQGHDESAQHGMLAACLGVLQDVHRSFFACVSEAPQAERKAGKEAKEGGQQGQGAAGELGGEACGTDAAGDGSACAQAPATTAAAGASTAATDTTVAATASTTGIAATAAAATSNTTSISAAAAITSTTAAASTSATAGAVTPELLQQDVRYHLSKRRERILAGCHVVFSHCWPTTLAAPYSHPLWRMAEALGAECSGEYERHVTTHVVAANAGTEKVQMARAHGKFVVGPDWLHACFFRWDRVPEADKPPPVQRSKGAGSGDGAAPTDELAAALRSAGGGGAGATAQPDAAKT